MYGQIDICPGELYLFPHVSRDAVYEHSGTDRTGELVFVCKTNSSTLRLAPERFLFMRTEPGQAVRINIGGRQSEDFTQSESFTYTDPATFLDENSPGLSQRERQRIRSSKKDMVSAMTVQFYTELYDETPDVSLSENALSKFISSHAADAALLGLGKPISASTLRRAIHDKGAPGNRALHYFQKRDEREREPFTDPYISDLKRRLIDDFWSKEKPKLIDVQNRFYLRLHNKNKELAELGFEGLEAPTRETLRLWINNAECYERYRIRHGKRAAGRRFRGQQRAIQATRPLEYVMFDHTRVDAWANIYDKDGKTLLQERPWLMLAIDVYSRMVLAAVLTFEPPSIYTVVTGMRQMVRPKAFFPPDIRGFKGVDDGWGKPSFIIVDNAWETAEVSFQTMCEGAGINIIWAPVRTPEFKTYVEHSFDRFNAVYWHRLPSGIPHKPHVMAQLGLDPRSKADRDINGMNKELCYAIQKLHVTVNDGIGMAPARAWKQGVEQYGRPMMDDVSAFDSLLGRVRQCRLTTSGIELERQRFHDPAITSMLLNDLLRFGKKGNQRKSPNSTGVLQVHVVMDPETCGYIHVWNPVRKRNVKLPNARPEFAAGRSWQEAKACLELAEKENLAFCSEGEMLEVASKLTATYEPLMKTKPFKEARKTARKYNRRTRLVPGGVVEEVEEDPSPTGAGRIDIPASLAAEERKDSRKVVKSSRRGGAAASKKAAATRRKKKAELSQAIQPDNAVPASAPVQEPVQYEVSDPAALLARLQSEIAAG